MHIPRRLLGSLLLACASCVTVASEQAWAPLRLTLDDHAVGPHDQAFVYVDGTYRGNFVGGKFVMYLTLEPHEVKVSTPGFEDWVEQVAMGRQQYPDGTALVVTPVRPD